MVTSKVAVVVAAVALVFGLTVSDAGAAEPADLVCGQVITASVVLRADLTCGGDGLIIGASGVTVRLAGHTIASVDGLGTGIRIGAPTAPESSICVDDAVVRDGTVSGFATGVATNSCWPAEPRHQVSRMKLTDNEWAIYAAQRTELDVDRTRIVGWNGIGGPFSPGAPTGTVELVQSTIQVTSPDGFSVRASSSSSSSRFDGGRIYALPFGRVTIADSVLTDVTVSCSDSDVAIATSRLVGGGILGGASCGYSLTGDHFVGRGSGVAVELGSGFPSTVADSVFTGWDTALHLGQGAFTVTGNTFRRNGVGLDLSCEQGCWMGTVTDNRFVDNRSSGMVLRGGTWRVGSNIALRNGGLGIDAAGPTLTVIDDGGNVARRNLPPQCVGVACASRP